MSVVLLCVIINRVDSKNDAREVRVKNDPYVFDFFFFRNDERVFSKTTNDEHRTWTYCRDRCASLKDTSELEWSACLYGCTASKQQEMSRSVRGFFFLSLFRLRFMYHQHVHTQKDCVEWCDGVKESPQAEAYMTENPSRTSRDFIFLFVIQTRMLQPITFTSHPQTASTYYGELRVLSLALLYIKTMSLSCNFNPFPLHFFLSYIYEQDTVIFL
mgnify:CR=1 FL=1